MSMNISRVEGMQPVVSFVSIIVLGVVIAVYVLEDESLRLPIILFSFFLGILVAALELRVIVRRSGQIAELKEELNVDDGEVKKQLAKFVADLFEEDIPYETLDEDEQKGINQLERQEKEYSEDKG